MNREWVIAGTVALLMHGLLLFGFRMESAAVALPAADTAIEVSLVAAEPAPAAAAPEAPAEPPPPEPPPVLPPPPPPVPEPAPTAEPTPMPREQPVHRDPVKPSRPSSTATKAAGPTQVARNTGAAPAAASGAGSAVRPRSNPKPPYPGEARRLGQQGRVLLEVQVSADGRATSVSVKHSSGFPILDNAAVEAVEHWTFEPARIGGLAVASRAEVPVNFAITQ